MANVLNRVTKEYRDSVNTPDYPPVDWIINPNLSAVQGFPPKYWLISGDTVTLMDQASRDALDAQLREQARDDAVSDSIDNFEGILRQIVKLMVTEINTLRDLHGLPPRTMTQIKNAIRSGYGS